MSDSTNATAMDEAPRVGPIPVPPNYVGAIQLPVDVSTSGLLDNSTRLVFALEFTVSGGAEIAIAESFLSRRMS